MSANSPLTLLIGILLSFSLLFSFSATLSDNSDMKGSTIILNPADYHPDDEERSKWKHQPHGNIKKREYSRTGREDGAIIIEAISEQSASGLVVPMEFDPNEYPVIEWVWKIESVLEKGRFHEKDGDD